MSAIVLALFHGLLISNAVAGLVPENIINGLPAKENQFKHQVSLRTSSDIHFCGGSLIEPNLVLTAAHCVYVPGTSEVNDRPLTVIAGTINREKGLQKRRVVKIYAHKYYKQRESGYMDYDIAVLRLESNFDINGRIDLASLPKEGENFVGQEAIVSGYGIDQYYKSDPRKGKSSGLLRYEIVQLKKCEEAKDITFMCGRIKSASKTTVKGVCEGDSGGPLIMVTGGKAKVIGIPSTAPYDCDEFDEVTNYTNVAKFLKFIQNAKADKPGPDTKVQPVKSK